MNEILFDKVKVNRTYKYLLPCLYDANTEYAKRLKSLYKYQVGLFDYANVLNNGNITYKKCVAIVFDTNKYLSNVSPTKKKIIKNSFYIKNTINFFRKCDNYVKDYPFHDPRNNDLHILVLKIPEKYYLSYSKFIQSEYSRMYDNSQMELFTMDNRTIKILKKDESIYKEVANSFRKEFGNINVNINNLKEFDFPLTFKLSEEIVNFDFNLIEKNKAANRLYLYNHILNELYEEE